MPAKLADNLERHLIEIVGDRSPHTAPEKMAQVGQYIIDRFSEWGLPPVKEPVELDGLSSFNVCAEVSGLKTDAQPILVGAHYDSIPNCPGADDNASAVAALLEIARGLKQSPPQRTVKLVAFALEEYGFLGSQVVAKREARVPQYSENSLAGVIALEMLGYTDKRPGAQKYPPAMDASQYPDTGDFIAVVGNANSAHLAQSLVTGMKTAVPDLGVETLLVPGDGELVPDVRRSDHVPFWTEGFSAVMLTDTANFRNPNYHQPTDTLDTLDLEFLAQVTSGLIGFLRGDA